MTGPSLDSLPPELLDTIVNLIEDEDGWYEFPTDALLNMRETCRVLERACHNRFLLYFHEWVVDLEKDLRLSKTKAVLASPVHTAAIEKITFAYKYDTMGIWQIALDLHKVFGALASLNKKFVLVFDPFADYKEESGMDTQMVMDFVNMIVVMVATSKVAISSIQVRARNEDWDKRHTYPKSYRPSLQDPYQTFPEVEYGKLLEQIHIVLADEIRQGHTQGFPPLLVAKYPGFGDMSFNYIKGCLKLRNLHTFHWLEFRDWIGGLTSAEVCNKIEIKGCNLVPSQLRQILSDAKLNRHPIRSLSIFDTVLYDTAARTDKGRSRTPVRCLLDAIVPYAHHLKYLHLANIWSGNGNSLDSTPAFEKVMGGLQLRKRDEMRTRLVRLRADHPDKGTASEDEDTTSQDENDTGQDEDITSENVGTTSQNEDTRSQDEDLPVQDEGITSQDEDPTDLDEYNPPQDEDTTSQIADIISHNEGTASQNEDITSQDEDTISPDGLWEFLTF
jgi:hypothetical protein